MTSHAFCHTSIGEFRYDDGAVDQQAHGHDQGEQHHHVDRYAERRDRQDAQQETSRDRHPDQAGGANAENADDNDEYQQYSRDHAVLQVRQHAIDVFRFVARGDDFDAFRPCSAFFVDQRHDFLDRADHVGAATLDHLDGQRAIAVQAGDAFRILVGPPYLGNVAKMNDAIADRLNRHLQHVFRGLEYARYLDREASPRPYAEHRPRRACCYDPRVKESAPGPGRSSPWPGDRRRSP